MKGMSSRTGEAFGEGSGHGMDRMAEIWSNWRSKRDETGKALMWSDIVFKFDLN